MTELDENAVEKPNTLSENYTAELTVAEALLEATEEIQEEHIDLAGMEKKDLVAKAKEQLHATDTRKANEILTRIREAIEALENAERPEQIKAWTEAGNDPRDFKSSPDALHLEFNRTVQQFREKRDEERRRAEEEKLGNLKRKEAVLEKMRSLSEGEETESSLKTMRELMREWREIRHIPKEFQQHLFEKYKFYVDRFYDNMSRFNELKDLDREKNLEIKIELIKKIEALKSESNIRKALITLHKFHDDWKNTGPVRREISDEIWSRFKSASDAVLEDKKRIQEQLEQVKEDNLKLKQLLVDQAEAAIAVLPDKFKDWNNLGKVLDGFMDQWKTIGAVPNHSNQSIWNRFKEVRNAYFAARKEFFKDLNQSKEENLAKKTQLCEQAEKLQESNEFVQTSDALVKLQEEWKKIGPVPDSANDAIWKRFRKAYDHFYARKNAFFEQRRAQESEAVKEKNDIITTMVALTNVEDGNEVFKQLKELQMRWAKSGFVSGKAYFALQKKYQELSDALFTKFKRSSEEARNGVVKEHYDMLAGAPDGAKKLQFEERKIKDRMSKLVEEKNTIENNMSFFAHAKNADTIKKQFQDNINKIQAQIEKLEKELKVIKSLKTTNG